jgi:hypothetical protein
MDTSVDQAKQPKVKASKNLSVQNEAWFKSRFPEIESIYRNTNGKTGDISTIVILSDGTKGISTLKKLQTAQDNSDLGILWAYTKAKESQAYNAYKAHIDFMTQCLADDDEDECCGGCDNCDCSDEDDFIEVDLTDEDSILGAITALTGGAITTVEEANKLERALFESIFVI